LRDLIGVKMAKLVNFEMEEEKILQLKKIAKENERSLSAQIRLILLDFLKENDEQRRIKK
jgi:hypothetical protein